MDNITSAEKLTALKAMVGGSDDDNVLSTYLAFAADTILSRAYPYNPEKTEIPARYDYLQIKIAIYLLNKRGAEGQVSHSENGVSRSYENADVPLSLLNQIVPFVGVI